MSLHYLDPDREPRECSLCNGSGDLYHCPLCNRKGGEAFCRHCPHANVATPRHLGPCAPCNGTGRLGEEGAEPDLRIYQKTDGEFVLERWYSPSDATSADDGEWRSLGRDFPTESAALAAARAASKGDK